MKHLRKFFRAGSLVLFAGIATVLLAGCETTPPPFKPLDGEGIGHAPTDIFSKGDLVTVSFAGAGGLDKKPHEERVKEDGTITPPDIGTMVAEGKTAGQLQTELQEKYDKLFRNLTVTVKAESRFYSVDGEVRQPGPKPYLGETDVFGAISAAGGFTEFAKKTKIRIIHPNGQQEVVNYEKALEDSGHKLPVYPGDQVYVPRRIF